jgi:hypothetical protein
MGELIFSLTSMAITHLAVCMYCYYITKKRPASKHWDMHKEHSEHQAWFALRCSGDGSRYERC